MEKKKKNMEWLVIFIILILMFTIAGTYAFLNIQEYYKGTFEVEIRSKGIDIFVFEKTGDVDLDITGYNFSQGWGHNVVGETNINPTLETTSKNTKICYTMDMVLPEMQVFEYTNGNNPELVLDVSYSLDGENYNKLIDSMDITAKTGIIHVPTTKNGNEYKFEIATTKGNINKDYFKASITFMFYKNVDQAINNNKSYSATLNANVVEC